MKLEDHGREDHDEKLEKYHPYNWQNSLFKTAAADTRSINESPGDDEFNQRFPKLSIYFKI